MLGDRVGTAGRVGRCFRSMTGRDRGSGSGRCRRRAVGSLVVANGHHTPAALVMNTGRTEEAADHVGVAVGRMKAVVVGSSLGLNLGCSRSCYHQCGLEVDIGSWSLWCLSVPVLCFVMSCSVEFLEDEARNVKKLPANNAERVSVRYTRHQTLAQHVSS